jgi:hypothetical protein
LYVWILNLDVDSVIHDHDCIQQMHKGHAWVTLRFA